MSTCRGSIERRVGVVLDDRDESYSYNGLDRLTDVERGEAGTGFGPDRQRSQSWDLDMLGNWSQFQSNDDGSAGYDPPETQDRAHNEANEITDITLPTSPQTDWADFAHDDAGNMTVQGTGESTRRTFTWDAWNRLREVRYESSLGGGGGWTGNPRSRHTYYGLHQRATTLSDNEPDASADPTEWGLFYYDSSWRLLQHQVDELSSASWTSPPTSFSGDEARDYVWGQRYIDELCYFRENRSQGRYAITDRNFSVIGLMEDDATDSGDVRIRYTAYGEAKASPRSDVNGDGTVDTTDRDLVSAAIGASYGGAGYEAELDVDRDGDIDSTDRSLVSGDNGVSIEDGQLSDEGCIVGYDGYVFDPAAEMYCVRYRWLQPRAGRWFVNDPLRYVNGSNLYISFRSSPIVKNDPLGLYTICEAVDKHCREVCEDVPIFWAPFVLTHSQCMRACKAHTSDRTSFILWYNLEKNDMEWLSSLPECPSKMERKANGNPKHCNNGEWNAPSSGYLVKEYHPDAEWCIRSKSVDGHAQQCCYDSCGTLIKSGVSAGTPDRKATGFDFWIHMKHDVNPWNRAKRLDGCDGPLMKKYLEVRPPSQGGGDCYDDDAGDDATHWTDHYYYHP